MWGAQPDLKQTLNVSRKLELIVNNQNSQSENADARMRGHAACTQQTKTTMESSLAALLCNQLLQHHQQQQQMETQQMNQSEQQIMLNQAPGVKIQILNQGGNLSIVNPDALMIQTDEKGWWSDLGSVELFTSFHFLILASESIEWTMNDLLQLKRQPTPVHQEKSDEFSASVSRLNQSEHKHQSQPTDTIIKCKEKGTVNHKRPSIAHEISNSKRAKGHDTIKPTPQLLQQLMTSPGCSQKNRSKIQAEPSTSSGARWSPLSSPQKVQTQQQPASNSVLMNLLVSGCDVSAGYYTCLPRPKLAKA